MGAADAAPEVFESAFLEQILASGDQLEEATKEKAKETGEETEAAIVIPTVDMRRLALSHEQLRKQRDWVASKGKSSAAPAPAAIYGLVCDHPPPIATMRHRIGATVRFSKDAKPAIVRGGTGVVVAAGASLCRLVGPQRLYQMVALDQKQVDEVHMKPCYAVEDIICGDGVPLFNRKGTPFEGKAICSLTMPEAWLEALISLELAR